MSWFKDLLSENSQVSSMRVMAFLALFTAIWMALTGKPGFEPFLYVAFGGKALQKITEVKNDLNARADQRQAN
jgi:hypothetical protein